MAAIFITPASKDGESLFRMWAPITLNKILINSIFIEIVLSILTATFFASKLSQLNSLDTFSPSATAHGAKEFHRLTMRVLTTPEAMVLTPPIF
jgi:hypothetical protein